MQTMVAIKTDVSAAASNTKSKSSSQTEANESFSTELDKHVSHSDSVKKQSSNTTAQKTNQDDKVKADDKLDESGKNLPADNTDETTSNTNEHIEAKATEDSDSDADTAETDVSTNEQTQSATPDTTEILNAVVGSPATEATNDKTVTVDEHAVAHSKTQQVTMVARQQSQQTEVAEPAKITDTSVEKAADTAKQAELSTGQLNPITQPQSDNEAEANAQAVKKVTSLQGQVELATNVKQRSQPEASLKDLPDSNAKPFLSSEKANDTASPIRADILNAINKPNGGEAAAGTMTLKNQLAAQLQQNHSAANQQLNKDDLLAAMEAKTDRAGTGSTPVTTVATGSATSVATTTPLATATPVTSLDIQPTVQSAAWSKVMSSRVVWMAKEGVQQAELKLKPANMGPVEVRLHVQNDQVSVTFLAQHATTRDALEQALPRLRDSFAENGIQLANAQVGEQHQQEQQQEHSDETASMHIFSQADGSEDDIEIETHEIERQDRQTSGLSLYA